MSRAEPTGRLFVLEGLDGSGKSTQARRLVERLEQLGRHVLHTREPGGTPLGERVREILLSRETGALTARTEVFLYQAARAQLVAQVIKPALSEGKVVVCERWHYATFAYQTAQAPGAASGAPERMVRETSAWAVAGTEPDRALYLTLPPAQTETRLDREQDRIESRGQAYRRDVDAAYRRRFAEEPERLRVVSAEGTVGEVAARVWGAVHDLLD
jgi:dTMP kinase